jgi:hypothetical protein
VRTGLEQDDASIPLRELTGDHASTGARPDHDDVDALVQPGTPGR